MKKSRFIAFLLAALMVLSAAATGVFALEETGTVEPAEKVELNNPSAQEEIPDTVEGENADEQTRDATLQVNIEPSGNTLTVTWGETTEAAIIKVFEGNSIPTDETEPVKEETIAEGETFKEFTLEYDTEYAVGVYNSEGTILGSNTNSTEPKPVPAPAAPRLSAFPAYHSVYLTWTPSENATKYVLYRTDGTVFDNIGTATSFTDTNNAADTTYSYYVVAFNGDKASEKSNEDSAARVRTCYYRITFKKNVKLTSHDGTKTKHTFKKGQVVYADGFSQGKYQFDYEGHRYHAKWMRIKKPSGDIATNIYENGVTPELYVKQTGYGSPTGYLIWVSLYSQHVYVFQGSAGNWTLVQDFLCGSGKAKTPTPTGMNKSLHKKMKKYSKHKWWNCFSGNNAIHGSNGAKEVRKLGRLISNGCVRVTNDQAIWIFNTVPKGTRVLVF